MNYRNSNQLHELTVDMRRPGFEPGLPDWQSDVLDQTGRPSHLTRFTKDSLTTFRCLEIEKCTDKYSHIFLCEKRRESQIRRPGSYIECNLDEMP